jgi:hypothetical protein
MVDRALEAWEASQLDLAGTMRLALTAALAPVPAPKLEARWEQLGPMPTSPELEEKLANVKYSDEDVAPVPVAPQEGVGDDATANAFENGISKAVEHFGAVADRFSAPPTEAAPAVTGPVAWTSQINLDALKNGYDCIVIPKAEGPFSIPLYAHPIAPAEPVAEHYRQAMLDAEMVLNAIPMRVTDKPAIAVDPVAVEISRASDILRKARHDVIFGAHPIAPAGEAGWRTVPVEPTEAMIRAAASLKSPCAKYRDMYRAMINAAPLPTHPGEAK